MKLIIKCAEWDTAVLMAQRFARNFPDRVGVRNSAVYKWTEDRYFIVYRLASGTIVVT